MNKEYKELCSLLEYLSVVVIREGYEDYELPNFLTKELSKRGYNASKIWLESYVGLYVNDKRDLHIDLVRVGKYVIDVINRGFRLIEAKEYFKELEANNDTSEMTIEFNGYTPAPFIRVRKHRYIDGLVLGVFDDESLIKQSKREINSIEEARLADRTDQYNLIVVMSDILKEINEMSNNGVSLKDLLAEAINKLSDARLLAETLSFKAVNGKFGNSYHSGIGLVSENEYTVILVGNYVFDVMQQYAMIVNAPAYFRHVIECSGPLEIIKETTSHPLKNYRESIKVIETICQGALKNSNMTLEQSWNL